MAATDVVAAAAAAATGGSLACRRVEDDAMYRKLRCGKTRRTLASLLLVEAANIGSRLSGKREREGGEVNNEYTGTRVRSQQRELVPLDCPGDLFVADGLVTPV